MTRLSGTLAARPAANTVTDTLYHDTASGIIYQSAGNQWIVRPKQPITFFVGISSAASVSALPSAAGNLGWVFETADTGKLYEGFPGGWVDVSDLVDGMGTSHADLVIQSFSNAAVTVTGGANRIIQTGTMSAPRAVTLAPASDYPEGEIILVTDHSGSVTGTNKLVIDTTGADTIDGAGDDVEILTANGDYALMSNGVDGWETVSLGGGGAASAEDLEFDPAVDADWDGAADPGSVNEALDQLAERTKDLEETTGGAISDPNVAHIRTDGNDTTGDGSPSAPFLTWAKAVTEGFTAFNFGVGTFAGGSITSIGEHSIVGAGENKTTITALTFSTGNDTNRLRVRGVTITTLTVPSVNIFTHHGGKIGTFLNTVVNGTNGVGDGGHAGDASHAPSVTFYDVEFTAAVDIQGGAGGNGATGSAGDSENPGGPGGNASAGGNGGALTFVRCKLGDNEGTTFAPSAIGGEAGLPASGGSDGGSGPGAGGAVANGGNGGVIIGYWTSYNAPNVSFGTANAGGGVDGYAGTATSNHCMVTGTAT